jgi:hypothetical protein
MCVLSVSASCNFLQYVVLSVPIVLLVLCRARDRCQQLNGPLAKALVCTVIPDIMGKPHSTISSMALFGGATGGLMIWLFDGSFGLVWLMIWFSWMLLLLMAFTRGDTWGPRIMSSASKHACWCVIMGFIVPLLSVNPLNAIPLVPIAGNLHGAFTFCCVSLRDCRYSRAFDS